MPPMQTKSDIAGAAGLSPGRPPPAWLCDVWLAAEAGRDAAWDASLTSEDRIKARISSVIRARTRAPEDTLSPIAAAIQRREPSLNRPRGPEPLIANIRPMAAPGLRSEPPVLGGTPAVPPQVPAANAFAKDDFITPDQPEMDDDLLEDDLDWQGDVDAADDAAPEPVSAEQEERLARIGS